MEDNEEKVEDKQFFGIGEIVYCKLDNKKMIINSITRDKDGDVVRCCWNNGIKYVLEDFRVLELYSLVVKEMIVIQVKMRKYNDGKEQELIKKGRKSKKRLIETKKTNRNKKRGKIKQKKGIKREETKKELK